MNPSDPPNDSTFVACKFCTRMVLFTYRKSDVSHGTPPHAYTCIEESCRFFLAYTICKRCNADDFGSFCADISDEWVFDGIESIAQSHRSTMESAVSHGRISVLFDREKLRSPFPPARTIRSVYLKDGELLLSSQPEVYWKGD